MNVNSVKENNEIIIENNSRKIKITNNIIEVFQKYRQINDEFEAGGILIARENKYTNNLIIEYATYPFKEDIRKKYRFYRKDIGHINYYNYIYNKNNGIYAYIGEWHTHPEDYPNPSSIDIRNWKKIWKENKEKDLINIIVGIKQIGIWKCNEKIERIY